MARSTPKADRARLCYNVMMVYTLLGSAISLASLLYHGLLERTPLLIDGLPYMQLQSIEWWLTAAYWLMHVFCAYLLYSGNRISKRWVKDAKLRQQQQQNGQPTGSGLLSGDVYAMPTRVAVGCAVLFSVSLMYILFYGTIAMSAKIEKAIGAAPPYLEEHGDRSWRAEANPASAQSDQAREEGATATAAATAAPDPLASDGEGMASLSTQTSPSATSGASDDGQCGASSSIGSGPNGELTWTEMFWLTLETFVDVFASLVDTGSEDDGEAEGYGGFASSSFSKYDKVAPASGPRMPLDHLRRLDLLLLNIAGAILSFWGIICFDITVEESQLRRRRTDGRPTQAYLAAQRATTTTAKPDPNPRGFEEAEERAFAPERHENPALTLDALGAMSGKDSGSGAGTADLRKHRKAKAAEHVAQQALSVGASATKDDAEEANPTAKKNQ